MEEPPSPLSATTTQSSLTRRNHPHLRGQNQPLLHPAVQKPEMKQKKFLTLSYHQESGRKMESCGDNLSPQLQQPGEQNKSNISCLIIIIIISRLDVMNLQEQLDLKLQQRQARETGICQVW